MNKKDYRAAIVRLNSLEESLPLAADGAPQWAAQEWLSDQASQICPQSHPSLRGFSMDAIGMPHNMRKFCASKSTLAPTKVIVGPMGYLP